MPLSGEYPWLLLFQYKLVLSYFRCSESAPSLVGSACLNKGVDGGPSATMTVGGIGRREGGALGAMTGVAGVDGGGDHAWRGALIRAGCLDEMRADLFAEQAQRVHHHL
jgi:hypothetical protein